jgi:hypothetical protein
MPHAMQVVAFNESLREKATQHIDAAHTNVSKRQQKLRTG